MTSTPDLRIVSAMSPVTPKPAAEFSTLATTRSMSCSATRGLIARWAMSRPGRPKMSPMKRMRTSVGSDRNTDLAAATLLDARQVDPQLALRQRGARAARVDGTGEPNDARESSERAFRHVKGCLLVTTACGEFGPRDEQGASCKNH